jgi:hypothetical protein
LEKSAKNLCSPDDLEKEMLQLGMSAEHAKQLHLVYKAENEELSRILCATFIRGLSIDYPHICAFISRAIFVNNFP